MKTVPRALQASLLLLLLLGGGASAPAASYTASWVGNSDATLEGYVNNCARSLWVASDGTAYASSMWDEKFHNIGVYKDGKSVGAMGGGAAGQGCAIGGDATSLYVALQKPAGAVGRFDRKTGQMGIKFQVAEGKGDLVRGIAVAGGTVYTSNFTGNKVQSYTTEGAPKGSWDVPGPGAIAVEKDGQHLWVAERATGTLRRFGPAGEPGTVIQMDAAARPSALHVDAQNRLWVGDQGPDMNIKIYDQLDGTPAVASTFGVQGGYLSTEGGAIRGTPGAKRFTRVVGIGTDDAGNVYVLNNPWGGTTDLGRDGATDLHCYDGAGNLLWTRQQLAFEGNGAPDPGTDGADIYGGTILYTGRGGAGYKANMVDPYRYPADQRINTTTLDRGDFFAQVACVDGKRILAVCGQNSDIFYTYYFHPETDGYVAIPGQVFGEHIRGGLALDTHGDVWTGEANKDNAIKRYPLTGFGDDGKPKWGEPESTPIPASIEHLGRLEYVPESDTLVLGSKPANSWVVLGSRVEVYKGWRAGNRTPSAVIDLKKAVAKSMAAAGGYLFVGYYAMPDVDVFDLATGSPVLTMKTDATVPYTGNDTDSMYGIRAFLKADGTYLVTKDDYNCNKIVVYTFTP